MDTQAENLPSKTTFSTIEQVLRSLTPQRVVVGTLVVVGVLLIFWFIIQFNLIVFGLLAAIVLSTAIRPAVDWLEKRGIPRMLSAVAIFLLIMLAFAAIIWMILPLMTTEGLGIVPALEGYYSIIRDALVGSQSDILAQVGQSLPAAITTAATAAPVPPPDAEAAQQLSAAGEYSLKFIYAIFILMAVMLLSLMITVDRTSIMIANLFFVPVEKRQEVRQFIEEIEKVISDWLRGQGLLCLVIGVMSLAAYWLIGLPYAIVLAIFAGLMEAIPIIGPFLGAVPAVFVALTISQEKMIWVIVATLIVQQLENHLLVPRIMKQSVGVSPVITLLAFVFFTSLFGLVGGLLAVPIAATVMLVITRLMQNAQEKAVNQEITGRSRLEVLRYENSELLKDLRSLVRVQDTEPGSELDDYDNRLEIMASELDHLLAEAVAVDSLKAGEA